MSIDCDPIDEAIFDIEDYVGGNIEGIDKVDRMAFTVFLRKTLTTAISTAVREARIEQVMQDFMSILVNIDMPENEIIEWRDNTLAQLKEENKNDRRTRRDIKQTGLGL